MGDSTKGCLWFHPSLPDKAFFCAKVWEFSFQVLLPLPSYLFIIFFFSGQVSRDWLVFLSISFSSFLSLIYVPFPHPQFLFHDYPRFGDFFLCSDAQSCLTLCDPMDCSLPGSSVHGILPAWGAISSRRGSSGPRDWTHISSIGRWIIYQKLHVEIPCFLGNLK